MKSICIVFLMALARVPQTPAQAAPVREFTGRLGPSAVVRARLFDGRTVTGRFADVGAGRLGVHTQSGATDTLALARVQSLAVRGRHTRTGAIVGGATGLAAGIFFGYVIGAVCDAAECDRGRPYLYTIPLFGGGGTLLGAVIGAAIPKWKQVYP